jgi:hypothetical protein
MKTSRLGQGAWWDAETSGRGFKLDVGGQNVLWDSNRVARTLGSGNGAWHLHMSGRQLDQGAGARTAGTGQQGDGTRSVRSLELNMNDGRLGQVAGDPNEG